MKKFVALMLVLCVIFAGLAGYFSAGESGVSTPTVSGDEYTDPVVVPDPADKEEAGSEAAGEDAEPAENVSQVRSLDYEAIYALHAPEDVAVTVNGQEVTWDRYFYVLYSTAMQIEDYFQAMAGYYGIVEDWADPVEEGGTETYARMAVEMAEDTILQLCAIEGFARENGVSLTADNRAEIEAQLQADIEGACGEGATEADFAAYLSDIYMSLDTYNWINETNYLYQQNYIQLYGETGELYGDEAAMAWLEDNGYLSASHILLMTMDPSTGEALEEADAAAKRAQAEELLAELQAIEDPEARAARFKELKEEFCEDSGKTAYPDGYTFTPGTMVPEFEDAVNALEDYEISGIVESVYGYHIILRLPLDVESVIEFSSDGTPMDARSIASNEEYGARLQAYYDDLDVEFAEGVEGIDLLSYIAQ